MDCDAGDGGVNGAESGLMAEMVERGLGRAADESSAGGRGVRRIVVKLGTNVLMRTDGRIALGLVCGLVESIAGLRGAGHEILVVSSGSIGLGVERLGLGERPVELAAIQACAAVGQSRLMGVYDDAFDRLGCRIAQVLLTEDDFRDQGRHLNLRRTLGALLGMGVIPIVNENDTVSTQELDRPVEMREGVERGAVAAPRIFGDNDKLSAILTRDMDADLLVLLSDVDGLFDRHPALPGARLIRMVDRIDGELLRCAQGGNERGRGGMLSKLEAARIVLEAGRTVVIANGRTPEVLEAIVECEMAAAGLDGGVEAGPMAGMRGVGTRFAAARRD